jgi:uncharacterized NAD(P)/FAD-binding protein YdhS
MKNTCDIVIVGGGFSGLMVAANAVRRAKRRLNIVWADDTGRFARGTAYGTKELAHLLNVPAAKMGAWADSIGDLSRWLASRYPTYGTHAFVPRAIYGEYLDSIASEMRSRANVHAVTATATGARHDGINFTVDFSDDTHIESPCLVLATGNPPCRDPGWPANDLFIPDFWSWRLAGGKIHAAEAHDESQIVIAGAGLTTIDAVMSLRDDGYTGQILAVSPHGQWPQPHAASQPLEIPEFIAALRRAPAARSYLRAFRKELEDNPGEWRAVVDSVRADTPALWQTLSEREKARFLRHLLSGWNTHRHRMSPEIHEKLLQDKKLNLMAGRIVAAEADGTVAVRPRGDSGAWSFRAAKTINCTGPSYRTLSDGNPLLADLRRQKLVRPGPLGMGIAAPKTAGLFAVGTPLIGERLETTAVPELRQQAADAAEAIVKAIPA